MSGAHQGTGNDNVTLTSIGRSGEIGILRGDQYFDGIGIELFLPVILREKVSIL